MTLFIYELIFFIIFLSFHRAMNKKKALLCMNAQRALIIASLIRIINFMFEIINWLLEMVKELQLYFAFI